MNEPTKIAKQTLLWTIIGTCGVFVVGGVVAWGIWSIRIEAKSGRDDQDILIAKTYATKEEVGQTNAKLETISRDIGEVQQDVAAIKGAMTINNRHGAEGLGR